MRTLLTYVLCFCSVLLLVACHESAPPQAERLCQMAYEYHYRNLDSTLVCAKRAADMAPDNGDVQAECLNHKAFVLTARMEYDEAEKVLDSVAMLTNNQVEMLVADVQLMRLCQRRSRNKDFYTYRERAAERMARIHEEQQLLSPHLMGRLTYAETEFAIVTSTYYYYVGLEDLSIQNLRALDGYAPLDRDTAQMMAYFYNIGAGGIISQGTPQEIAQTEFDYLMRCLIMARRHDYPFWMANSLQAISEHLQDDDQRQWLMDNNQPSFRLLNPDNMPDSLLAGYLAQQALDIFSDYGDVYQIAGGYRTLAQCYWGIADYHSALFCLKKALEDNVAIMQAPDLVASIREQLSLLYSAVDDKENSDINRNLYLDLQEQTRQDRYLESRAEQLDQSVTQLNVLLMAVVAMVVIAVVLLIVLLYMRRRNEKRRNIQPLLAPLEEWKRENDEQLQAWADEMEEIDEQRAMAMLRLEKNKIQHLEQRAKVSLVNTITPLIDRMNHEIRMLDERQEAPHVRKERFEYVAEITDKINEYNDALTRWIQIRQGQITLHISSFPVQQLFDMVAKGSMAFQIKGVTLSVIPSSLVVKADRVLSLFMVNTLADNARKFTPEGGQVTVYATEGEDYVEISVADTGEGMTEEQLSSLFTVDRMLAAPSITDSSQKKGHGFGLVNCKGIIEKYKKISDLFCMCAIGAESTIAKGSRLFFRLPKGVVRSLLALCLCTSTAMAQSLSPVVADSTSSFIQECDSMAANFADSAYHSNVNRQFVKTLAYADSVRAYLNKHYLALYPSHADTLVALPHVAGTASEIFWWQRRVKVDYEVILSMRNESAVAALALHLWDVYKCNNKVYTQLFKERSRDDSLDQYCRMMLNSKTNKNVAVLLLILLLLLVITAYFILYYRHKVHYRLCVERVNTVNDLLKDDSTINDKIEKIEKAMSGSLHPQSADSEQLPENLVGVVKQILTTLKQRQTLIDSNALSKDMAEDELRRLKMDEEKIYVCNSVLDNCLSTLKHETMYYPSRIRMLVDEGEEKIGAIRPLAEYYKDLYSILSLQAMRQLEGVRVECKPVPPEAWLPKTMRETLTDVPYVYGDAVLLKYMMDILQKENKGSLPQTSFSDNDDGRYLTVTMDMRNLSIPQQEIPHLFSLATKHLSLLLCRQIVRDIGESTNSRRCGISAQLTSEGYTQVTIVLTKCSKQNN